MRALLPVVGLLLALATPSTLAFASELPKLASPGAQARLDAALAGYARASILLKAGKTEEGNRVLAESIAQLRELTSVEPRAWVYYALGQALRRKGDCESAIVAYREALWRAPKEAIPAAMASELVDRTKQQIGNCVVESPPSPRAPVETSPSTSPAPAASIIVPPSRSWRRDPAAATLVAVGLGGVVASSALFGHAESLARDQDRSLAAHLDARRAGTERLAAAVTISVGGALVVGGIVRWVVVARRGSLSSK